MAEQDENATAANSPENRQSPAAHLEAFKFKPGQSGNPTGRPKKKPITELYEKILSDPKAMVELEVSIRKTLKKGQMAMVLQLREMADRIEGKLTQPMDVDVTVNLADVIAEARKRVGLL